jgi:hypothetical protein
LRQDSRLLPVLEGIVRAADEDSPTENTVAGVAARGAEIGWNYGRDHDRVAQLIDRAVGAAFGSHDPYFGMDLLLTALENAFGDSLIQRHCEIVRDIFENPFRSVTFSPEWRTDTTVSLARPMYESRDFSAMPILADALQDAGCDSADILNHCRDTSLTHVRGCWVVDLVLGKQ